MHQREGSRWLKTTHKLPMHDDKTLLHKELAGTLMFIHCPCWTCCYEGPEFSCFGTNRFAYLRIRASAPSERD